MMMFDYLQTSLPLMNKVLISQKATLEIVASKMAATVQSDNIIYAFGTGHSHMIPMELFGRAGGLANVCAMLDESILNGGGARRSSRMEHLSGLADVIWQRYQPQPGDILFLVSNSGRNAAIVEMALKAKEAGIYTIAITSMAQTKANGALHASGLKLYEIADVVLDNCAPDGDALISVGAYRTGGLSSLSGILLVNSLLCECVKLCHEQGIEIPLFQSQNTDRKTNNEQLFTYYSARNPHM